MFRSHTTAPDGVRNVGPRGRTRRHRSAATRVLLAGAALAVVAAPVATAGASRVPAGAHSALKPDYAFFRGKTINVMVTNAPGTSGAIAMVALQPFLNAYLDANIEISYSTQPINVGDDIVAGETPDGLHLGITDITGTIVDEFFNTPLTFAVKKLSIVGATKAGLNLMVACANSPITSPTQLIHTTTQILTPVVFPSESYLGAVMFLRAYGLNFRALTGYTGPQANQACQAGNGNWKLGAVTSLTDSAGTAPLPGITPLLLGGKVPAIEPQAFLNSEVSTIAAFTAKHPPKTKNGKRAIAAAINLVSTDIPNEVTFGPEGIPANRMLALTDAFLKAAGQPAVKLALAKGAIPAGSYSPTLVRNYINNLLRNETFIRNMAGITS